jgi:hypothetical protein
MTREKELKRLSMEMELKTGVISAWLFYIGKDVCCLAFYQECFAFGGGERESLY